MESSSSMKLKAKASEAADVLIDIMESTAYAPVDRIKAAAEILDRVGFKPDYSLYDTEPEAYYIVAAATYMVSRTGKHLPLSGPYSSSPIVVVPNDVFFRGIKLDTGNDWVEQTGPAI